MKNSFLKKKGTYSIQLKRLPLIQWLVCAFSAFLLAKLLTVLVHKENLIFLISLDMSLISSTKLDIYLGGTILSILDEIVTSKSLSLVT